MAVSDALSSLEGQGWNADVGWHESCDSGAIRWWVTGRYRTMRGYKCERSAVNVSRLIAYCGNHLATGLNIATLLGKSSS